MEGALTRFLEADHARLDALLERAAADDGEVEIEAFGAFREGLLRHIAMEEKVVLPLARERRDGVALPVARRLRADHSALATLLVPNPTPAIAGAIRRRLIAHNPLEEGESGMYAAVERLLRPDEITALVERLQSFPQPPVAPYSDNPRALARVRDLIAE